MIAPVEEKLTKKEKKELKKMETAQKLQKEQRGKMFKKIGVWLGIISVTILAVWGLVVLVSSSPSNSNPQSVEIPKVNKNDITIGNPKAKVTLVEYADFECPACAAFYPIVKQVLTTYDDKILYVYRNFPLPQHQFAKPAAYAAYAAYKQGKFLEMKDELYVNQDDWSKASDPTKLFKEYAQKIGLNMDRFNSDFNSGETKKFIDSQENQAITIGINSTPTFFINEKQVQNLSGFDEFKKLIDNALKTKE